MARQVRGGENKTADVPGKNACDAARFLRQHYAARLELRWRRNEPGCRLPARAPPSSSFSVRAKATAQTLSPQSLIRSVFLEHFDSVTTSSASSLSPRFPRLRPTFTLTPRLSGPRCRGRKSRKCLHRHRERFIYNLARRGWSRPPTAAINSSSFLFPCSIAVHACSATAHHGNRVAGTGSSQQLANFEFTSFPATPVFHHSHLFQEHHTMAGTPTWRPEEFLSGFAASAVPSAVDDQNCCHPSSPRR